MWASRLSPVRQNRTKRKMSAYSSDLEPSVKRTTQIIIGRFRSTSRLLIPTFHPLTLSGRKNDGDDVQIGEVARQRLPSGR
jgi:hypothetical protein